MLAGRTGGRAEITRTRSDVFIPFREVPDGKLPNDRAEQLPWLRARGEWIIRHDGDGLTVEPGHGNGDAALTARPPACCSC